MDQDLFLRDLFQTLDSVIDDPLSKYRTFEEIRSTFRRIENPKTKFQLYLDIKEIINRSSDKKKGLDIVLVLLRYVRGGVDYQRFREIILQECIKSLYGLVPLGMLERELEKYKIY